MPADFAQVNAASKKLQVKASARVSAANFSISGVLTPKRRKLKPAARILSASAADQPRCFAWVAPGQIAKTPRSRPFAISASGVVFSPTPVRRSVR